MNLSEKINFIENYKFDESIISRVKQEYNYTDHQIKLLIEVLKDYFLAHLLKREKKDISFITMASFHVDQLWHWFILFTPQYREFCNIVFGDYLDHIPTNGIVPTKTHKDETYFNTLNYLKVIKQFRNYSNYDLMKLNTIPNFYSIFAIDYIIENNSYSFAIKKSLDDLDLR